MKQVLILIAALFSLNAWGVDASYAAYVADINSLLPLIPTEKGWNGEDVLNPNGADPYQLAEAFMATKLYKDIVATATLAEGEIHMNDNCKITSRTVKNLTVTYQAGHTEYILTLGPKRSWNPPSKTNPWKLDFCSNPQMTALLCDEITFEVNGSQVTAKAPNGEAFTTHGYVSVKHTTAGESEGLRIQDSSAAMAAIGTIDQLGTISAWTK